MLIWKLIHIQSKPAKTNIYYLGWIRFTWNKHDSTNMETGIPLLLFCMWYCGGHVCGQEQKHVSPLGTKLYFHVNSWHKHSIVLTPNMTYLIMCLQTENFFQK